MRMSSSWHHRPSAILPCSPPCWSSPRRSRPRRPPRRLLRRAGRPAEAKPAEKPWYEKVEISGLLFGDAYAVVTHHDPDIDGQWGFWLRRGYLTFDFALARAWSARFRLEVNSPGDFESSAKMTPFVKDA